MEKWIFAGEKWGLIPGSGMASTKASGLRELNLFPKELGVGLYKACYNLKLKPVSNLHDVAL